MSRTPTAPRRRFAALAGALYLLTFATSIPALLLKQPLLDDPGRVVSTDGAIALAVACVLELVLAAACVGTAVALFPIVGRVSPMAAVAFVAARTVEATLIVVGVAALRVLAVDGTAPIVVALHDELFLLGPGLVPAINALCLAPVLLRGRLVPRGIPVIGLVGAPLLMASVTLTLVGVIDQVGALAGLLALPIAVWEFSLGAWLLVRGVRDGDGGRETFRHGG
ncbi:DUF4386 domain-containing protein [Pseudoclavibacter chungangensis]|uniref:DUF4386 domain-containing protein n=1 Tax=Pseudoclavibacter chungangensis TaxID=587635 RepID=A0A7J5BQW9_9MICO|nr:DUF4386 domain-containing protein [Pseudoclavibacter chungangensis]KAB1654267.1 DUF4386 domain-containing protein [Pseudoclavibacter chungangensis]